MATELPCIDFNACNYDPNALEGSYQACEYTSCAACRDFKACNYSAIENSGYIFYHNASMCDYSCYKPSGCKDVRACNYDFRCTDHDQSSCTYCHCIDSTFLITDAEIGDEELYIPEEDYDSFTEGDDIIVGPGTENEEIVKLIGNQPLKLTIPVTKPHPKGTIVKLTSKNSIINNIPNSIYNGETSLGEVRSRLSGSVTWSVSGAGVSISQDGKISLDSPADKNISTEHSFTVFLSSSSGSDSATFSVGVIKDLEPSGLTSYLYSSIDPGDIYLGYVRSNEPVSWLVESDNETHTLYISEDEDGNAHVTLETEPGPGESIKFTITAIDNEGNETKIGYTVNVAEDDPLIPRFPTYNRLKKLIFADGFDAFMKFAPAVQSGFGRLERQIFDIYLRFSGTSNSLNFSTENADPTTNAFNKEGYIKFTYANYYETRIVGSSSFQREIPLGFHNHGPTRYNQNPIIQVTSNPWTDGTFSPGGYIDDEKKWKIELCEAFPVPNGQTEIYPYPQWRPSAIPQGRAAAASGNAVQFTLVNLETGESMFLGQCQKQITYRYSDYANDEYVLGNGLPFKGRFLPVELSTGVADILIRDFNPGKVVELLKVSVSKLNGGSYTAPSGFEKAVHDPNNGKNGPLFVHAPRGRNMFFGSGFGTRSLAIHGITVWDRYIATEGLPYEIRFTRFYTGSWARGYNAGNINLINTETNQVWKLAFWRDNRCMTEKMISPLTWGVDDSAEDIFIRTEVGMHEDALIDFNASDYGCGLGNAPPTLNTSNLKNSIIEGQTDLGYITSNEDTNWETTSEIINLNTQARRVDISLKSPAAIGETYTFDIKATDELGASKTNTYSSAGVSADPTPPVLNYDNLVYGDLIPIGESSFGQVTANETVTWTISSDQRSDISIDEQGNVSLENPTTDGEFFTYTITATDEGLNTVSESFDVYVVLEVFPETNDYIEFKLTTVDSEVEDIDAIISERYNVQGAITYSFRKDGLAPEHRTGYSISLNKAGNRIAVGSPTTYLYENETYSEGYVQIFEKNEEGSWIQLGENINGDFTTSQFGYAVNLNDLGDRVVISNPKSDGSAVNEFGDPDLAWDSGSVKVFEWSGSSWDQLGQTIVGDENQQENFGHANAINSSGNRIFISTPFANSNSGEVIAYELSGSTWVQLGQKLTGSSSSHFGDYIDVNSAGDRIIISGSTESFVYELSGNSWQQIGQTITSGSGSVSITPNGNRIVCCDYTKPVYNSVRDEDVINVGSVKIFDLSNNSWVQLGNEILGDPRTAAATNGYNSDFYNFNTPQGEHFGKSSDINEDGNLVIIGAPVSNGRVSTGGYSVGTIKVFKLNNGNWEQNGETMYPDPQSSTYHFITYFGHAVQINDDGSVLAAGLDPSHNHQFIQRDYAQTAGHFQIFDHNLSFEYDSKFCIERLPKTHNNSPVIVDWGDGVIGQHAPYTYNVNKNYSDRQQRTVRMTGSFSEIYFGKFTLGLQFQAESKYIVSEMKIFGLSSISSIQNLISSFPYLTNVDLSSFDSSGLTSLNNAFAALDLRNTQYNYGNSKQVFPLKNLNLSGITAQNVTDMSYMFQYQTGFEQLDLSSLNTSNVTDMSYMFHGVARIENIILGENWNTSNVTNMTSMFEFLRIWKPPSTFFNNWNTSSLTSMRAMFKDCENIRDLNLSSFDTSNVTDMNSLFQDLYNLCSLDISSFDTSSVTNMSLMFYEVGSMRNYPYYGRSSSFRNQLDPLFEPMLDETNEWIPENTPDTIKHLDLSHFDTSSVTRTDYMFYNFSFPLRRQAYNPNTGSTEVTTNEMHSEKDWRVPTINTSSFNTSNVTHMQYMFAYVDTRSIDVSNFDTSSATNMNGMFSSNIAQTINVSSFNTSNVTTMSSMFSNCDALHSLDVSNFNTSNVTNMSYMFSEIMLPLDLSNFDTSNVTHMQGMFSNTWGSYRLNRLPYDDNFYIPHGDTSRWRTHLDLSSFNTSNVLYMDRMFSNSHDYSVDFSSFDTSSVISFQYMFANSGMGDKSANRYGVLYIWNEISEYQLYTEVPVYGDNLDISTFTFRTDASTVEMFSGMRSIKTIDANGFQSIETENPTTQTRSMSKMFYRLSSYDGELNVSGLYTDNVTNMSSMFELFGELSGDPQYIANGRGSQSYVSYLGPPTLDLSTWNTSSVQNMSSMFKRSMFKCIKGLECFDISAILNSGNISMMLADMPHLTDSAVDFSQWCLTDINNPGDFLKDEYSSFTPIITEQPNWGVCPTPAPCTPAPCPAYSYTPIPLNTPTPHYITPSPRLWDQY